MLQQEQLDVIICGYQQNNCGCPLCSLIVGVVVVRNEIQNHSTAKINNINKTLHTHTEARLFLCVCI